MAPARAYEPLIVMLTMRAPEQFASEDPAEKRDGGIQEKRRRHQEWEPEWPCPCRPSPDPENASEKAERNRSAIAQKHPRRVEIKKQESDRGPGTSHTPQRQICNTRRGRDGAKSAEREQGHSTRKTVCAVHEIEQICDPDDSACGQHSNQ